MLNIAHYHPLKLYIKIALATGDNFTKIALISTFFDMNMHPPQPCYYQ